MQNILRQEVKLLKAFNGISYTAFAEAIGVKQITKWINGEISNKEMIEEACKETRHYAKRQITWFKNQFDNKVTFTLEQMDDVLKNHF